MIYLDHAATTPVPKAVADAMYAVLAEQFGNPSSQYPLGLEMKRQVESWRKTVADALGCEARQLFFTSCGTEADNWAVTAACWQNRRLGRHIVTTAVEHSAVIESCRWMERQGYEVTYLAPPCRRLHPCGGGPRRRPAGHGPGLCNAGEQRAGERLPPRRHRPEPFGEEPPDPAPHRRGPGLFEGPLLRQNPGGGSHHRLRPQDRRAQGHRRPVYRPPGEEPEAAPGGRRAGRAASAPAPRPRPRSPGSPRRWSCGRTAWRRSSPAWQLSGPTL